MIFLSSLIFKRELAFSPKWFPKDLRFGKISLVLSSLVPFIPTPASLLLLSWVESARSRGGDPLQPRGGLSPPLPPSRSRARRFSRVLLKLWTFTLWWRNLPLSHSSYKRSRIFRVVLKLVGLNSSQEEQQLKCFVVQNIQTTPNQ